MSEDTELQGMINRMMRMKEAEWVAIQPSKILLYFSNLSNIHIPLIKSLLFCIMDPDKSM